MIFLEWRASFSIDQRQPVIFKEPVCLPMRAWRKSWTRWVEIHEKPQDKKSMKRLFLAATAAGLLMTMNASATLVVDFNTSSDYRNSRAKDANTDTGDIWNYSDTIPLLDDVNGQSGKIYGGVITGWSVPQPDYNPWVLKNPNDGFVAHVTPPDKSGTQSATGAYLWVKSDFLEGTTEIVQLNPGDSITYDFNGMTGGNQEIRLIVKQGGITYISQWWTAGYTNVTKDPTETNWAVLDTTDYTWGDFSPLTLEAIEGAGVYYTLSVTGDQCLARIFDFQIDATVVPAPGTDELIVAYYPSAVDAQGARGPDITTLDGATWDYSDTAPLLDDSDETGQNGRIYGGVSTTWSVPQEHTPPMYDAPDGGFTVQVNPPDKTGTQLLKAVYLWNKADFLVGSSDIVQFNAGSHVSYNFSWVTADGSQRFRMVVKQGGVVYISEWTTASVGFGGANVTSAFTSTNWAVLNTTDYTWGTFAPVTFDDVEGVGLYSEVSRTNEQAATRLIAFEVEARVIPDEGGDDYSTWATANGIAGEPFDDDFNSDGITNGVAYGLGLSPTESSQPAGMLTGNTISFTKGAEAIANADVRWIIEISESLEAGSWSDAVTQDPGDATPTISYDLDPIPATPKKFARLKVLQAAP